MELSGTVLSMKKLLLSYVKLGCRREVSRSRSNVMALCSRTDKANSRETYIRRPRGNEIMCGEQFCQCGQDPSGSNRVTVVLD